MALMVIMELRVLAVTKQSSIRMALYKCLFTKS